jgi:hypothetical protein
MDVRDDRQCAVSKNEVVNDHCLLGAVYCGSPMLLQPGSYVAYTWSSAAALCGHPIENAAG